MWKRVGVGMGMVSYKASSLFSLYFKLLHIQEPQNDERWNWCHSYSLHSVQGTHYSRVNGDYIFSVQQIVYNGLCKVSSVLCVQCMQFSVYSVLSM